MIIGRNLVESLYSDFNGYEGERLYSESELEELMEIAFSEGYEEAERLFGDPEGRHRTEETYVRERQGGKTARVAERNKTVRHAVGETKATVRAGIGETGKTIRHAVGETGATVRGGVGEGGKTIRHAGETLRGMGKDYLEAGTKNLKNYEDFAAGDRSNRRSARTERMEVRSGRQAKYLDTVAKDNESARSHREGRMGLRNENRADRRANRRGTVKDYYDAVLSNEHDRRREGLAAKILEDRKDARRARNERQDRKLTAKYGR